MKNTQIRCGTGRIRTANLSFITSALPSYYPSYRPDRQFLWPTMPLQGIDRTPIGLAGCPLRDIMSKSQSYMLYGRYHCRFRSYSSLGSRGQLRLSPPGSLCQVTQPARAAGFLDAPNLSRRSGLSPYCSGRWPMGICPTPNPLLQWNRLIASQVNPVSRNILTCQGTLLCSAGRTRTLHLARAWAALLLCYCGGPYLRRP